MIAALYVDPRGPYPRLGADCYDEARDALTYVGPGPIVAHPPCGPWGALRHEYRGVEHALGLQAVEQVRRWGGVLEHPAGSALWAAADLPPPGAPADAFGGYSVEIAQVEWGHVARKRTWLYLVRVPREALEAPPHPGRAPTHWVSGSRKPNPHSDGQRVPAGIKVCSARQRRRTPPLLAAYLLRLAAAAGG